MKQWRLRELPSDLPPKAPAHWGEKLSVSPLLLDLLWRRGLTSLEEMDAFLSAKLASLTPPQHWPRLTEAALLLADALRAGKRIAVWGDYDVDGVTATTLVLDVLETHGIEALHHIPDRNVEGYGVNVPRVEALAAQGCDVLLTVDCGIADVDAVTRAHELGMTVVVSDHHLPPDTLPPADVICDPRLGETEAQPFRNLAGVGVAFYLMAALNTILAQHTGKRHRMDACLDLVALGTLADVMPLLGENRILVRGGLAHMTIPARPGMAALKRACGLDPAATLNAGQAVFRLAPRINAAGRMDRGEVALQLLRAKDAAHADSLARTLDELNTKRRQEEDRIHLAARQQALDLLSHGPRAGLVLYGKDWHPGIVGIVASRIVDEFYRPTIILCDDKDYIKGSGRSVREFDLYAGLSHAADLLTGFGGHKQAAGVRLTPGGLAAFRARFEEITEKALGSTPLSPTLTLEGLLDFSTASDNNFLKELELMQPFGPGNPEPVFQSPPLLVKARTPLGYGKEHVQLRLKDSASNITLQAKAWGLASELTPALLNQYIQVAYTPRLDTYSGIASVDVNIKDWRPA